MKWSIDGNKVACNEGESLTFDYPIRELVDVGSVAVVVLDVPTSAVMNENVFAVSDRCKCIWQIQRVAATAGDPANVYVGASRIKGNPSAVSVTNWNGVAAYVDVNTGRVLDTKITK